jgi:hypothetical protein
VTKLSCLKSFISQLFNEIFNVDIKPIVEILMNVEHLLEVELAGETEILEKSSPSANFLKHKTHMI